LQTALQKQEQQQQELQAAAAQKGGSEEAMGRLRAELENESKAALQAQQELQQHQVGGGCQARCPHPPGQLLGACAPPLCQ
jgi:molecular chaperone GrpE (heat shock protein)